MSLSRASAAMNCLWLQLIPSEYQNDESSRHKTLGMYMYNYCMSQNIAIECVTCTCVCHRTSTLRMNPTFCDNGMFLGTMISVHELWLTTSRLFIFKRLHWCYFITFFQKMNHWRHTLLVKNLNAWCDYKCITCHILDDLENLGQGQINL